MPPPLYNVIFLRKEFVLASFFLTDVNIFTLLFYNLVKDF